MFYPGINREKRLIGGGVFMTYFQHEKAIVDEGAKIGDGTRLWANVHIQAGVVVGEGCNICNGSFIEKGATVGNQVTIKHNVSIFDGVTIEDDVFIGSNIAFINDRYPRSNSAGGWTLEKTIIKKGATLGSNAVVLCGIIVGKYAMVAAGSIVTRSVGPHQLVCGNPAKIQGHVCVCGKKLDYDFKCVCGKKYLKEADQFKLR